MIVKETKCFMYISNVENHKNIKPKILHNIQKTGEYSMRDSEQSISNTDWHLRPNFPRPYWDIFKDFADSHNNKIMELAGFKSWTTCNYWFQQYKKGDYHKWHIHGDSLFSNVYYVDLPNDEIKTEFILHGELLNINVKEGQILTFPSFMIHRSPENIYSDIKTVVAFNTNFSM